MSISNNPNRFIPPTEDYIIIDKYRLEVADSKDLKLLDIYNEDHTQKQQVKRYGSIVGPIMKLLGRATELSTGPGGTSYYIDNKSYVEAKFIRVGKTQARTEVIHQKGQDILGDKEVVFEAPKKTSTPPSIASDTSENLRNTDLRSIEGYADVLSDPNAPGESKQNAIDGLIQIFRLQPPIILAEKNIKSASQSPQNSNTILEELELLHDKFSSLVDEMEGNKAEAKTTKKDESLSDIDEFMQVFEQRFGTFSVHSDKFKQQVAELEKEVSDLGRRLDVFANKKLDENEIEAKKLRIEQERDRELNALTEELNLDQDIQNDDGQGVNS